MTEKKSKGWPREILRDMLEGKIDLPQRDGDIVYSVWGHHKEER